ncbi:12467_t:CDS:1, partial [Gigaspora rosea]
NQVVELRNNTIDVQESCHKELAPHTINLQSSSLGMPFSNIDLNSHVIDDNVENYAMAVKENMYTIYVVG